MTTVRKKQTGQTRYGVYDRDLGELYTFSSEDDARKALAELKARAGRINVQYHFVLTQVLEVHVQSRQMVETIEDVVTEWR